MLPSYIPWYIATWSMLTMFVLYVAGLILQHLQIHHSQVFVIAKQQSIKYHETHDIPILPTIDVDASWVVRSKTIIANSHNKVAYIIKIALCLANAAFNIVLVCNSDKRHHSKRATIKRTADSYNDKLTLLKIQIEYYICLILLNPKIDQIMIKKSTN
jgi:hypothetical protein